jgi:acetylglutamate kinase
VVLKLGGEVLADELVLARILEVARDWQRAGVRLVIVHGGGAQVDAHGRALGLVPVHVHGRRVTDLPTLHAVVRVLGGELSAQLAVACEAAGLAALCLTGVSGGLLRARSLGSLAAGEPAALGFVGEVTAVDTALLEGLWQLGRVPVIASMGLGGPEVPAPRWLNVNADTAAAAVARALGADHLLLCTAVGGVFADRHRPDSRIPRLDPVSARAMIADGRIAGGMIPKVEEALAIAESGVGAVHILGPDPAALRAVFEAPGAHGTVVAALSSAAPIPGAAAPAGASPGAAPVPPHGPRP